MRAALFALLGAIVLGGAIGFLQGLSVSHFGTKTHAETLAIGFATGLNSAAVFALVLVPVAVVVTFVRARLPAGRTPFR